MYINTFKSTFQWLHNHNNYFSNEEPPPKWTLHLNLQKMLTHRGEGGHGGVKELSGRTLGGRVRTAAKA